MLGEIRRRSLADLREPFSADFRTPHQNEAETRKSVSDSEKEELSGFWLEEL